MKPETTKKAEVYNPYIPDSVTLPELTAKALILGIILAIVLGGANAYLGLFAGMTVSASIPASVISMAVLRFFGKANILENNIVQTSAAAGESVAAGVIFTIPALVILGVWSGFNYWETTLIAALGGTLGVLFTVPLRRALIVENPLQYPEGTAIAEVLKVGESGGAGVRFLAIAGVAGAAFKLGETGLRLWRGSVDFAAYVGGSIAYIGSNLSPALVAVGYIVGLNIAVLIFAGGALNWWVAIPLLASFQGVPEGASALDAAGALWSTRTRYIGVGSMVVGGLWALIRLRRSILSGIRSGADAYRHAKSGRAITRSERDIPMQWIGIALIGSVIPLFFTFRYITGSTGVAAVMAVIMLVAGFLFSAVAAYMAGLVGSSNNPISGVTIATVLTSALLLLVLMGADNPNGPAAAVMIGAVVACGAAIAGDNMQDLKTGRIVGSTPIYLQIVQAVGAIAAAFVMAPVLTLLMRAYGIGAPTPAHPDPLPAPQANLMASVAQGVFRSGLPMDMVAIGALLAVAIIMFDLWQESRGATFRTPVLAVAVGIYLPFELSVPIFLGGLVSWASLRAQSAAGLSTDARAAADRNGLLVAAGLITGEALVGIGMAIPIVLSGRADVLAIFGTYQGSLPGMILLAGVMWFMYRSASSAGRADG